MDGHIIIRRTLPVTAGGPEGGPEKDPTHICPHLIHITRIYKTDQITYSRIFYMVNVLGDKSVNQYHF